uniref:Uncharacterized protein n=1 Tax=viral metagenome TaxID=1070528 RepID=A0A6M3JBX1_9ZZZZ
MKKTVFIADKDGTVEALGIKIDAKPDEVKVLINGTDITETLTLERVEVIVEKKVK